MPTQDDWKFDIRKIKAHERDEFIATVRQENGGHIKKPMIKWIRRTVIEWPEGCDWSSEAGWKEADFVEYEVCLKAFLRDFENAIPADTEAS